MQKITFLLALLVLAAPAVAQDHGPFTPSSVDVYYSPSGGCTTACVAVIDGAKKTIFVQAYSFTSMPIAQALVNAKNRGVTVHVILDKSDKTGNGTLAPFLANAGVSTFIDPVHAIAHNKIMVIDGEIVITGSFNFTKAAESSNAENMLVIHGRKLAIRYTTNWQLHLAHSVAYFAPTPVPVPEPEPAPAPGP